VFSSDWSLQTFSQLWQSSAVSKNAESRPEGICEAENHDLATGQSGHAKSTLGDFLKRYKIPKKSYSDSSESDGEITDPYEEDYCAISSDNRSEVSEDTDKGPTRFGPLEDAAMFP
jgi:hypothetical protein